RALRAEATRACTVAAGALEAARAVRDPFAAGSLDTARERLAALEAASAQDHDAGVPEVPATADVGDPEAELEVLETRRKRLEAARAGLFDAERAVRLPEVDRLDVEALENAHEQVLIAQDRSEKRFSGSRAEDRLEEVRQVEREILDRLGFRTYTDFVLG